MCAFDIWILPNPCLCFRCQWPKLCYSTHQIIRCAAFIHCHSMAQRPDLRDWAKTVKAKTMFRVKKCRKYKVSAHIKISVSTLNGICTFRLPQYYLLQHCGWSAVRPSNMLQECIWGDNLEKQWAFALFPEQHHHQNYLKSKTKTLQSTKGSSPGQAGTWRVAHAALPATDAFLQLLLTGHHVNLSRLKWGAEDIHIKIKQWGS